MKSKAMWIYNPMTSQMQLLSTAVTTGLDAIDILTIFLKRSEPLLANKIQLSLSMFNPLFSTDTIQAN